MSKSYHDLDIYKISLSHFIRVHKFSLCLPKYEPYEPGSQLRRSADSINSNIVEGYANLEPELTSLQNMLLDHGNKLTTDST